MLGHEPGNIVSMQAFDGTKDGGERHHRYVTTAEEMLQFIEEYGNRLQIYMMLNPVKPGTNLSKWPTENEIQYTHNIYLDIDCHKTDSVITDQKELKFYAATAAEYEAVWPTVDIVNGWLTARGFGRGYSDKTGNGIRFVLPIPSYDVSDPIFRKIFKFKTRNLYDEIENDSKLKLDSVQDTRRISGVPGTLNRKRETETRKNRMREPGDIPERFEDQKLLDHILSLPLNQTQFKEVEDLKRKLARNDKEKATGEPKPAATPKTKFNENTLKKLSNLFNKDQKLKRLYSDEFITYKEEYRYSSRSEADQAMYNKLVFYGFSDDEINNILSKAKIGKWETAKPSYKESTKLKAHLINCESKVTRSYRMTDRGNAQRMNDLFGDELLYCNDSKAWFHFDKQRWKEDKKGFIFKTAKDNIDAIHDYAASLPDGDIETDGGAAVKEKQDFKKKWQKHASSSESTARIKAMVENLQSENDIPVCMEDFDLNGWILPVQNGTIDLKTGKHRDSKRLDMCTKMIDVVYDPAAICPEWNKFLNYVLPEPDTQRFMKELIGYCLTGETKEEQIYILYGTGSNGKSTFTDTISLLFGDFGINVKPSTLLTSDNNQSTPDNELAMLKGKRFASASEPKKGIRLGEDVIKAITNAKSNIIARHLYQKQFVFRPSHKVLLSTNHKPTVTDQSRGMRRRLRLIPFTAVIEESERDRGLSDKLENELSGILNWAIEGCLSWQKAGHLKMSAEIERETAGYMANMDRLTEFLGTVTEPGEYKDRVPNMWLRDSYNIWAERMGFRPMNNNTFNEAMIERDYKKTALDGRVQWRGLKKIITKIEDIENQHQGRLVATSSDLVETETLPRETVETILKTIKTYENNNNGGNCDIRGLIEYVEKYISQKVATVSLDGETVATKSPLIAKTENNNGNGSCHGANIKESVNDEPGENTLEMERLSIKAKYEILGKMKVHFEGKTGEKLTAGNLEPFGRFVHDKYDEYSIYDVRIDAKNKFSLGVPA